ncbi:MAG: hypothetical protein ACR2JE_07735 [Acidobacteriaceae bacterium]
MGIILSLSFLAIALIVVLLVWSVNAANSRAKAREASKPLRDARTHPDQTTDTRGTGIN